MFCGKGRKAAQFFEGRKKCYLLHFYSFLKDNQFIKEYSQNYGANLAILTLYNLTNFKPKLS